MEFTFDSGSLTNLIPAVILLWRVADRIARKGWKILKPVDKWAVVILFLSYLPQSLFYFGRLFLGFTRSDHGFLIVWSRPFTVLALFLLIDIVFDYAEYSRESSGVIEYLKEVIDELKIKLYG